VIAFELGDIVTLIDRQHLGEIIAIEADRVQVRSIDKYTGKVAELFFAPGMLQLVRRQADGRSLTVLTYQRLLDLPPNKWAIQGMLRAGELAVLYGPPGRWKTFIALDFALSIATGEAWCGHTTASGGVLYIAGEGLYAIRERTKAWVQRFGRESRIERALHERFFVLGDPVSFLEAERERLLKLIESLKPSLIVVDTLARCMAGADENSAEDMGLLIRACDRLRRATGATVLLVHHSGKSDPQTERGSSALRGACDTMLAVSGDPGKRVTLRCEKQKEGEPFEPITFELDIVGVGIEQDGAVRTSGRVRQVAAGDGHGADDDAHEEPSTTIQRTLAESFFEDGATNSELMAATKISRATFFRHRKKLVDAGIVERFLKNGHHRYRLTPKSSFYKPPQAPNPSDPEGSPSLTSLTQSYETHPSQSQSHHPPSRGVTVRRHGDIASPSPQQDQDLVTARSEQNPGRRKRWAAATKGGTKA
jgi:hypothetical protein